MDDVPILYFHNVPNIAVEQLSALLDGANATNCLAKTEGQEQTDSSYRELTLMTIGVIALKAALPALVTWLLNKASPIPRAEIIEIRHPDGRVETHTVIFGKHTEIEKLLNEITTILDKSNDQDS